MRGEGELAKAAQDQLTQAWLFNIPKIPLFDLNGISHRWRNDSYNLTFGSRPFDPLLFKAKTVILIPKYKL